MNTLTNYSRFVRRVSRRYASEWQQAEEIFQNKRPEAAMIQSLMTLLQSQGYALGEAMRIARQLVMRHLIQLDVEEGAPLEAVMQTMTDLAEVTLKAALQEAWEPLCKQHGKPMGESGNPCAFWVMGMGKLGGSELNVSSDIDLVYLYEESGKTAGGNATEGISNHEFFSLLAKALYQLIGEVTEHGLVFRMDLGLRPNGKSGPVVANLAMLKTYFYLQGRDWERFAWMKARMVAGAGEGYLEKEEQLVQPIVLPFVFRRYLDFNILSAMREMHHLILQQMHVKYADSRVNRDVKLSRGGIREIEFFAQLYQIIRGGQFPELRTPSTLQALEKLKEAELITADQAETLKEAYVFLRRVEHRIQYLDDHQTHLLPSNQEDLNWIAQSLSVTQIGQEQAAILAAFKRRLKKYQSTVIQQFDGLLQQGSAADALYRAHAREGEGLILTEASFVAQLPAAMQERVRHMGESSKVQALKQQTLVNLSRLILQTGEWLEEGLVVETAAQRFVDWLEVIIRRENYQAMLLERPLIHQRLLRILGRARWVFFYLLRYPGVLDELQDKKLYQERFNAAEYEHDLLARREALRDTLEEDEEALLNILRRAYHAELFKTLARDVEGYLSVEEVADDLSFLADSTLKVTMDWSWDYLKKRHRPQHQMSIIAYGKLGGIELGYGSDLDIVFVYDDDDELAGEVYAMHVRKIIQWVSSKTAEGDLFEIDMGLRPNGSSGLLVSSMEAFEAYQMGRGSNPAWTWEHQALTRARLAVGPPEIKARFDRVRHQVITTKRDLEALRKEFLSMRSRIANAYPVKEGEVNVKHSVGGMLDIEFCVQYLVLGYSWQYQELEDDVGNIALLLRAQQAGVLAEPCGQRAAESYRMLREVQHRDRLDDLLHTLNPDELHSLLNAGKTLWETVFQEPRTTL